MELYSLSFVLLVTVGLLLYYTVLRTPPMARLLGLSLVFFAASGWQDFAFLLFTALTVWGGGLCLAKLDTDAAAAANSPACQKKKRRPSRPRPPAAKRACWPVSWL